MDFLRNSKLATYFEFEPCESDPFLLYFYFKNEKFEKKFWAGGFKIVFFIFYPLSTRGNEFDTKIRSNFADFRIQKFLQKEKRFLI